MYTPEDMADYMIGWDAEGFRGEGDYVEYVRTYIMWPLSSGHRVERERGPRRQRLGQEREQER